MSVQSLLAAYHKRRLEGPLLQTVILETIYQYWFVPCDRCTRHKNECKHISAEELAVFWRLRGVSKQWRSTVGEWLYDKHFSVWTDECKGKIHVPNQIHNSSSYEVGRHLYCLCFTMKYKDALGEFIQTRINIRGTYMHNSVLCKHAVYHQCSPPTQGSACQCNEQRRVVRGNPKWHNDFSDQYYIKRLDSIKE